MSFRKLNLMFLFICLLVVYSAVPAQQGDTQGPQLETVTARKAALQSELDALGPVDEKAGKDENRIALEQLIATVSAVENALKNRADFSAQLSELPKRRQELEAERKALESRKPSRFPQATEALREQYKTELETIQAQIETQLQEIADDEVRVNIITEQLEQQDENRAQLQKELREAQNKLVKAQDKALPQLEVKRLEWQLQLLPIEKTALEAERNWLTERTPLQDAQLSLARLRQEVLQRDLETIKAALGEAIAQEQAELEATTAEMADKLQAARDPVEALRLSVAQETLEIQKITADYRQQLSGLSNEIQSQQQRNIRLARDVDRLKTLVEKAASGEGAAQRMLDLFARLRSTRQSYSTEPAKALQTRLDQLNERLFVLDDRLYDFDNEAEARIIQVIETSDTLTPQQRDAVVAEMRPLFDAQKAALRAQQQGHRALVQNLTELLGLHREYQRLLDESYGYALTKLFWIRNAEVLNWDVIEEMLAGVVTTSKRLADFAQVEQAQLWKRLSSAEFPWLLGLFVIFALPLAIYALKRWLRAHVRSSLAEQRQRSELPRMGPGVLITLQSTLWPAYLFLLLWLWGQLERPDADQALAAALVSGLQLAVLILWIALLGRGILLQDGWGQRFWMLNPKLCRYFQNTIVVGCVAALVFLMPRHVLLSAPGEPADVADSLALARILFLGFQLMVLGLVGVVGWRGSPLMSQVLTNSRKHDGYLWRGWPFMYLMLLLSLLAIMMVGVLGYRYASLFIFSRIFGSFLIILIIRVFLVLLALRILQKLVNYLFDKAIRMQLLQRDASVNETLIRTLNISRLVTNILLAVAAVFIILELWGVPATWLFTSPLAVLIIERTIAIAFTIGLALLFFRLSKAVTTSLLQTRMRDGKTQQAGRKLRTLAPLVHASLNVIVIFAAVVIILQLLGFSLGPVLAGVGIFGLAIGFAAQSLIKDIINGIFILFQDALSVGDIVDLGGGTGGQVEKVSLKSVTIRDLGGNIHVVPNGTIERIKNMTKDFSRYVLDVGVAYREDVDTIIAILREIDEEMRAESEYGKDMLEPIEIMGLDRFEDSAVIVRARLKTRPIEQWRIGREFNRRLKKIFDERGIEIPFPHRTLYWGQPKQGAQPPISVAMESQMESKPTLYKHKELTGQADV